MTDVSEAYTVNSLNFIISSVIYFFRAFLGNTKLKTHSSHLFDFSLTARRRETSSTTSYYDTKLPSRTTVHEIKMGCSSSKGAPTEEEGLSTIEVMFRQFDRNRKGYISLEDLQLMMKEDPAVSSTGLHIQNDDARHIMNKYGSDGKLTLDQFKLWWNSTYTTYNNEDEISRLVNEVQDEITPMDCIPEFPETTSLKAPHNSFVAVSRS